MIILRFWPFFKPLDPDPDSEIGSRCRRPLNPDPILIWIRDLCKMTHNWQFGIMFSIFNFRMWWSRRNILSFSNKILILEYLVMHTKQPQGKRTTCFMTIVTKELYQYLPTGGCGACSCWSASPELSSSSICSTVSISAYRRWWTLSLLLCISTVIILFSFLQFTVPHDNRPTYDSSQEVNYIGKGFNFVKSSVAEWEKKFWLSTDFRCWLLNYFY